MLLFYTMMTRAEMQTPLSCAGHLLNPPPDPRQLLETLPDFCLFLHRPLPVSLFRHYHERSYRQTQKHP